MSWVNPKFFWIWERDCCWCELFLSYTWYGISFAKNLLPNLFRCNYEILLTATYWKNLRPVAYAVFRFFCRCIFSFGPLINPQIRLRSLVFSVLGKRNWNSMPVFLQSMYVFVCFPRLSRIPSHQNSFVFAHIFVCFGRRNWSEIKGPNNLSFKKIITNMWICVCGTEKNKRDQVFTADSSSISLAVTFCLWRFG